MWAGLAYCRKIDRTNECQTNHTDHYDRSDHTTSTQNDWDSLGVRTQPVAYTVGNEGSRFREPLEWGRRVQTAMFFFKFCLIIKPTLPENQVFFTAFSLVRGCQSAPAWGRGAGPRRKSPPTRIHKVILQETTATIGRWYCTHYQLSNP